MQNYMPMKINVLCFSLNLYDFSQINNHEIGVLIIKEQEKDAYTSSLNEAQRTDQNQHR